MLVVALLIDISIFVPAIILLIIGFSLRSQHKYQKSSLAIIISGFTVFLLVAGWQWVHPRIVMLQDINVFNGRLYTVTAKGYKLTGIDGDTNLSWEYGGSVSMVYATPTNSYAITEYNPIQQKDDLKYSGGYTTEDFYNNCIKDLQQPYNCTRISGVQNNTMVYGKNPPEALCDIKGTLIALTSGGQQNITVQEAKSIFESLTPATKTWELNALLIHYNGGILTFNQPGNYISPL